MLSSIPIHYMVHALFTKKNNSLKLLASSEISSGKVSRKKMPPNHSIQGIGRHLPNKGFWRSLFQKHRKHKQKSSTKNSLEHCFGIRSSSHSSPQIQILPKYFFLESSSTCYQISLLGINSQDKKHLHDIYFYQISNGNKTIWNNPWAPFLEDIHSHLQDTSSNSEIPNTISGLWIPNTKTWDVPKITQIFGP